MDELNDDDDDDDDDDMGSMTAMQRGIRTLNDHHQPVSYALIVLRAFRASSVVFPWRVFYISASTPADAKDWIDLICWKISSKLYCNRIFTVILDFNIKSYTATVRYYH